MRYYVIFACLLLYVLHCQGRRKFRLQCRGDSALQKNCFMRRDEGHSQMDFCKSREQKVMWFFLADSKVCARMKYEGCGGNGNRYCTKKLCYEACNTTDTDTTKHGHYNRLLKQRIHG